jgi:small-conductance mechanosensitive channel
MKKSKSDVVVGFYKDRRGKTRPIVKPKAELNRPKNIKKPRQFRPIRAEKPTVDVSQRLEDLLQRLSTLGNQRQDLILQRQELQKAAKDTRGLDELIGAEEVKILRLRNLLKKFGAAPPSKAQRPTPQPDGENQ